jgi:dihydrofolate synthase/folylpolyglutamate synthase
MDHLPPLPHVPVITVGGTNGKGSTTAYLEAILSTAGYKVGCYTSPHLMQYQERIRVGREKAQSEDIVLAFRAVEAARGDIPLTYFEFGTLAAFWHFQRVGVDVLILEVGMGGRLDAVNVIDADCAIVTSVDLDHMEFLGPDRETIAFEKAGIYRSGRIAIFGEPEVPLTLKHHAEAIGAPLWIAGRDFRHEQNGTQWALSCPGGEWRSLPYPALRGSYQLDNASCALAALLALKDRLPLSLQHVREGLVSVRLSGRLQILPGEPAIILDVAHNPHAARALAKSLINMKGYEKTWMVLGMLHDKDVAGVTACFKPLVDHWFVASLPGPRGSQAADIARNLGSVEVTLSASPEDALDQARRKAGPRDRIVVTGSFITVANVLAHLGRDTDG